MSQALQSKVHLLAVLLAAFTLLSVPMFMQLRDDTAEALPHAKETLLSKMFRDASKQFQDEKLDPDEQIEDAWMRQAHQNNPNCQGSSCESQGDLDGDGVSNGDELKNSTNPACDEDKNGEEYCRGADRFNVTNNPTAPSGVARKVLLFSRNFTFTPNNAPLTDQFQTREAYSTMEVYANVTAFQGVNWQVNVRHPESGKQCSAEDGQALAAPAAQSQCSIPDAPTGSYNVQVSGFATSGRLHVTVYGIANGS